MYAVTFDLDTLNPSYKAIMYTQIAEKLIKSGFQRTQFSVYQTKKGLDYIHYAIENLKTIKNLDKVIANIQVYQLLDGSDFTTILKGKFKP